MFVIFPNLAVAKRAYGEFKAKADFSVWGASKSAREAIEKAGGSVKILAPAPEAEEAPKTKKPKKKAAEAE